MNLHTNDKDYMIMETLLNASIELNHLNNEVNCLFFSVFTMIMMSLETL